MQTERHAERNAAFMRCVFVLFAASLFAAPAQGQTHWAAKTGNDSNSCTNLSSLYLGCNIAVMLPGLSFATIVMANVKSAVDASLAVFTGYGITGKKYIVYDSNLILPSTSTIPGIDFEVGDGAVVRQERFSQ